MSIATNVANFVGSHGSYENFVNSPSGYGLSATALGGLTTIPRLIYKARDAKSFFENQQDYDKQALQSDRDWAREQAQMQMDFQERMSNTAWQRGVEDMREAGLNPYLALTQGGASAPQGSMAGTSSTAQAGSIASRDITHRYVNTAASLMSQLLKLGINTVIG